MPAIITFTNGRVAIQKGPVGLLVFGDFTDGDDGPAIWMPLKCLDARQFKMVEQLLDWNSTFPWWEEFHRDGDFVKARG